MPALYEHKGYRIERIPIPMKVDGDIETTGWSFSVCCPLGRPVPVIVESLDRSKGLRETRKQIEKYMMSLSVAETDLVSAQMN